MCTLAANHQKSIGIEQVHLTSRTPQAQQRRISIHILKKKIAFPVLSMKLINEAHLVNG